MTSRERVWKTLRFEGPDRAPRDLWALAGVTNYRKDEYDALLQKYPGDFTGPRFKYGESSLVRGTVAEVGTYVDEWGCEWSVAEPGVCGEVKNPPLTDWSSLGHWQPPWELLSGADFSEINPSCAETTQFVRMGSWARPFERMQFLRGTENLFMDLAWQPKELFELRDMIFEFELRNIMMMAKTDVDAIGFMDDWGTQHNLLISPQLWREFYKPLYQSYCNEIKRAGKAVFFHSDGHIASIIPDLIEIGVDAVNTQIFCMDIEQLAKDFKGKITFWGEISRQDTLPFGTVTDVQAAVRRVRTALDDGRGGVIAQCEWGNRDPRENIEAVFETWLE